MYETFSKSLELNLVLLINDLIVTFFFCSDMCNLINWIRLGVCFSVMFLDLLRGEKLEKVSIFIVLMLWNEYFRSVYKLFSLPVNVYGFRKDTR